MGISTKRIRHLPKVNDNEQLIGAISIGDIVNTSMIELKQESAAMQVGQSAASGEFS